ncbi:hypothetical protein G6R29_04665 [Fructobacillus sp. M2-14]|uniref:Uncharacterized protein n=1 Tax=Fructobacillus broussonetiae TaxID=2713173 RepID=A0ABS5R117_9LACO|nr:hypothetical protein [Fructobacillus broussonetiae]MBS9338917.1 hypothetical protein [Fructobacillus broussonetiae]
MITLTAYHGTSQKNAARILQEGFLHEWHQKETEDGLERYPNDLGNGVYGYVESGLDENVRYLQSARENAFAFARGIRKVELKNIRILKLEIKVHEEKVSNLNDLNTRNEVVALYRKRMVHALAEGKLKYVASKHSRRNQIDGVVLEYLFKRHLLAQPDIVLIDSHTRFDGTLSNISNGNEVAVRNMKVITNIQEMEEI